MRDSPRPRLNKRSRKGCRLLKWPRRLSWSGWRGNASSIGLDRLEKEWALAPQRQKEEERRGGMPNTSSEKEEPVTEEAAQQTEDGEVHPTLDSLRGAFVSKLESAAVASPLSSGECDNSEENNADCPIMKSSDNNFHSTINDIFDTAAYRITFLMQRKGLTRIFYC